MYFTDENLKDINLLYKGVDINELENITGKGQKIVLYNQMWTTRTNGRGDDPPVCCCITTNGKQNSIFIDQVVMGYYNKEFRDIMFTEEHKYYKIHHINGINSDNRIDNLRIISLITKEDFNDWNYRYRNTDINQLINAKYGDKIEFCERLHTVGANHSNRLWVSTAVHDYRLPFGKSYPELRNTINTFVYRMIMEVHLGRLLVDGEDIHHINGDIFDNRVENLRVVTKYNHSQIHAEEDKTIYRQKRVINIKTNEIFDTVKSITDNGCKYRQILAQINNRLLPHQEREFMLYDEYIKQCNKEYIDFSENSIGIDTPCNSLPGWENYTDFI